jgi:hypothetical protein
MEALKSQSDEDLVTLWRFVAGGEVKMEMPRVGALVVKFPATRSNFKLRTSICLGLRFP